MIYLICRTCESSVGVAVDPRICLTDTKDNAIERHSKVSNPASIKIIEKSSVYFMMLLSFSMISRTIHHFEEANQRANLSLVTLKLSTVPTLCASSSGIATASKPRSR